MLLLEAIAEVESGNRVVTGDHGAAVSKYQIHREVWQDVHRRFGNPTNAERGQPYIDVGTSFEAIMGADVNSRIRAQNTANGQLAIIEEYLIKHGVGCTAENIYACWNLGRAGFRQRNFHLDECPAATIRAAMRVASLSEPTLSKPRHGQKTRI